MYIVRTHIVIKLKLVHGFGKYIICLPFWEVVEDSAALRACGSTVFILNSLNRLHHDTTVHGLNKYYFL